MLRPSSPAWILLVVVPDIYADTRYFILEIGVQRSYVEIHSNVRTIIQK